MKRLRILSVTKRFRRQGQAGVVTPLDDISVDVDADEMVVLLGPSGCGKTTLLRCVSGLERPDEGEIIINGQLVFSSRKNVFVPPEARPVSMVFQSYALWPHMTVFNNVAYPLSALGLKASEVKARVAKTLDTVGLPGLSKQFPAQLSGGQQQRVALARALVRETGVILFDEPLSNVDAVVREQLREELSQMQEIFRFSGLYVTHDQTEAMAVGDRIAVLDSGKVKQIGSPIEIYNQPASRTVGSFIGAGNILEGTITAVEGTCIHAGTVIGPVRLTTAGMPQGFVPVVGQQTTLMIRPENILVSGQAPAGDQVNVWKAKLQKRLFLGPYWELRVRTGGESLRVWAYGATPPPTGPDIWLSMPPVAISVVASENDARSFAG